MKEFSVSFNNRDFTASFIEPDLEYVIENYSWNKSRGGPKECTITAYGNRNEIWRLVDMLRVPIEVFNDKVERVWWGYIAEVVVRIGTIVVGVSLDNMSNKVKVIYSDLGQQKQTGWAENTDSSGEFGTKELKLSEGESSSALADQIRDVQLDQVKYPMPIVESQLSQGDSAGGSLSARITCRGWWETTSWQYYQQDKGLESFEESGEGTQRFAVLAESGSLTFQEGAASPKRDGQIIDRDETLHIFQDGDNIRPTGAGITVANRKVFTITKGGGRSGCKISVEQSVTADEAANASLIGASAIAFSFENTTGSAWNLHEVHMRIQEFGDASAQGASGLLMEIFGDGSGSAVNPKLASGSLACSDISDKMDWVRFTLDASVALTSGTPYWANVRTVLNKMNSCAYYIADMNEGLGYTKGTFEMTNNDAWYSRSPDADILFKCVGLMESTCQIIQIQQGYTEFITDTDIADSSSRMSELWRSGDRNAQDELVDLLELGTTNNRRLLGWVDENRILRVEEESASTASPFFLDQAGEVFDQYNNPVEKSTFRGGVWAQLKDVIPDNINLIKWSNPDSFFIEEVEYYVQSDTIVPRIRGADNPFAIGLLREGDYIEITKKTKSQLGSSGQPPPFRGFQS